MRVLNLVLFVGAFIGATGSSTCNERCMRRQKNREDMERCIYVKHRFPSTNTMLPPVRYQDLYGNDSQTTLRDLKKDREYCTNKLVNMVVEVIVYILIFIGFVHTIRYPLP